MPRPNLMAVAVFGGEPCIHQGTAFAVGRRYLLTARHVVAKQVGHQYTVLPNLKIKSKKGFFNNNELEVGINADEVQFLPADGVKSDYALIGLPDGVEIGSGWIVREWDKYCDIRNSEEIYYCGIQNDHLDGADSPVKIDFNFALNELDCWQFGTNVKGGLSGSPVTHKECLIGLLVMMEDKRLAPVVLPVKFFAEFLSKYLPKRDHGIPGLSAFGLSQFRRVFKTDLSSFVKNLAAELDLHGGGDVDEVLAALADMELSEAAKLINKCLPDADLTLIQEQSDIRNLMLDLYAWLFVNHVLRQNIDPQSHEYANLVDVELLQACKRKTKPKIGLPGDYPELTGLSALPLETLETSDDSEFCYQEMLKEIWHHIFEGSFSSNRGDIADKKHLDRLNGSIRVQIEQDGKNHYVFIAKENAQNKFLSLIERFKADVNALDVIIKSKEAYNPIVNDSIELTVVNTFKKFKAKN